MNRVFLGLGGNIGNLSLNFRTAKDLLDKKCGRIVRSSSVYRTPPWGFESENSFLNQVIELETMIRPEKIMEEILGIEKELGRVRTPGKYTSRTIDIDILYYNNLKINNPELVIPHPMISVRKFVLVPLSEIAPDFIHPVFQKTNYRLLQECKDESEVLLSDLI